MVVLARLFWFAWLNKALLSQKFRLTHYWMAFRLHFQIVYCILLSGVRQMAGVDNITLKLSGFDVVTALSSQSHPAQLL